MLIGRSLESQIFYLETIKSILTLKNVPKASTVWYQQLLVKE